MREKTFSRLFLGLTTLYFALRILPRLLGGP